MQDSSGHAVCRMDLQCGPCTEEVADSIVDARDIINARHRAQLVDNSDRFPALNSVFDNVEYPKDFKPTKPMLLSLPCNTRFIKGHKPSNHIRARIKSHVYTTE